MRGFATFQSLAILLLAAGAAYADPQTQPPGYSISWDFVFDFDDGLQGWYITGEFSGNPIGEWVDPSLAPNGPMLPDGFVSGSSGLLGQADTSAANDGGKGLTGGGSLYLPGADANGNEAMAHIAMADLVGVYTVTAFQMMADIYIPNMWQLKSDPGLANAFGQRPGNDLCNAGIGAERDDNDAIVLEGRRDSGNAQGHLRYRDFTGSNSSKYPKVGINPVKQLEQLWENMGQPTGACLYPLNETDWWDRWVTLFMDYNYGSPGEVVMYVYIPWEHPYPNCGFVATAGPGWEPFYTDVLDPNAAHLPSPWHEFRLGGDYSWTQGQWDNVKLKLPQACNDPFADIDGDNDVDQTDFGIWQYCFTGVDDPNGVYDPIGCGCFDRDGDSDVDETDRAAFLTCASSSGPALPADPSCD